MEIVKLLLSKGADVNARALYGRTALCMAADLGDFKIGKILLEHGADPNLECDGQKISGPYIEKLRE